MASRMPVNRQVALLVRRLPTERIITWSVIGLLLMLVLFEWQSLRGYRKTLVALEELLPAGQPRTMTAAEVDSSVHGWASKHSVTERGQSFIALHWPSLFRTYTIWLTVDQGGLVTALHSTGAMPDVDDVLIPNVAAAPNAAAQPNLVNSPPQNPGASANPSNPPVPVRGGPSTAEVTAFLKSPVGKAFQKCHQLYFQNPNEPNLSDEVIETLQAVAGQLPKLELSTKPHEATWNHLKIFEGGIPFSAFRFSSTLDQPADLSWVFTGEESNVYWYILPARGQMSGFTEFRRSSHPRFQDQSVPAYEAAYFQTLGGGEIKPGQDYIVYFTTLRILTTEFNPGRSKSAPILLSVAMRLLPTGQFSPAPGASEIAELVGAPLYSSPGGDILCRNNTPVQIILPVPGANQLVLCDRKHTFRLWDVATKSFLREFHAEVTRDLSCAAISPDGKRLATAAGDNPEVLIWDLENADHQKPLKTIVVPWNGKEGSEGSGRVVVDVAFLKDHDPLFVYLNPRSDERWGEAAQWSIADDREIRRTFLGQNLATPPIPISGGEQIVAVRHSGDPNNVEQREQWKFEVVFLDSATGEAKATIPLEKLLAFGGLILSPDEKLATISTHDAQIIVDCVRHEVIQKFSTTSIGQTEARPYGQVVCWSPDSRWLAVANPENTILVWDVRQDRLLRSWRGHVEAIQSLAFTSDGKWLVSGSDDGTVRLWPQESPGLEIVTNSLGMKLVPLPGGEFLMGTPRGFGRPGADLTAEQPQHRVRISRPFYMGMHEVTVKQFRQFVDATGFKTTAETNGVGGSHILDPKIYVQSRPEFTWRTPGFPQADDHPVVQVSWDDTQAFCKWLSNQEQAVYRLPTEAEWEYACRAEQTGVQDQWNVRAGWEQQTRPAQVYGNVADQAIRDHYKVFEMAMPHHDGFAFTAPVGSFAPNFFGLYDMHGNVFEWCADWYDRLYYRGSPAVDPQGPPNGNVRVQRGGGFSHHPGAARSGYRDFGEPTQVQSTLGFRVVREFPSPTNSKPDEN